MFRLATVDEACWELKEALDTGGCVDLESLSVPLALPLISGMPVGNSPHTLPRCSPAKRLMLVHLARGREAACPIRVDG